MATNSTKDMEDILIINLHGFNSAPGGKADFLRTRFNQVMAPQLPMDTAKVMDTVNSQLDRRQGKPVHIAGTSLGGFYTLYTSRKRRETTIFYHLINTPLTPHLDLAKYKGRMLTNPKTGKECYVSPSFIDSLEEMGNEIKQSFNPGVLDRMFLYAGLLDDVVDSRLLIQFLSEFNQPFRIIREAQNHQFSNISSVAENIQKCAH
jgi:predicted esterase YcpF (UPF0227 family)